MPAVSLHPKPPHTPREARRFVILYGQALPALKFSLPSQRAIDVALCALARDNLTPAKLRPVMQLMAALDHGSQVSPLCYEVLRASYRAVRLIDQCLRFDETGRRSVFLKDLRRQIAEDHWLSPAQIICLNKNLARLDRRLPKLREDSFRKARPHMFVPF